MHYNNMSNNNSEEIERQEKIVKYKAEQKIEFENLRHKNIMEEIEAMKKAGITVLSRGTNDKVEPIKSIKPNDEKKKKKSVNKKKRVK